MNKETPQSVINEAQNLIIHYGQCLVYLGEYLEREYYHFKFPDGTITGFPIVYVYNRKDNSVLEISGFEALNIIESLKK